MNREDNNFEIENEIVEEVEENIEIKVKKPRRWPTIVITAVITIFVTLGLSTFLFFSTFGDALNVALRYKKLYEIETIIESQFIGDATFTEILDGAASGMVAGIGDQWSSYLPAEELAAYNDNRANSYVGIGVTVSKNVGEYIYVSEVNPNGGAYNAGILSGDYIKEVEGIDILDMALEDVTALIKGEEGTTVNLTIIRDGNDIDITVERLRVIEPSIESELIGDVGYVKILNFYNNTADDFILAVDTLKSKGASSLVFDVRFNGCGYLRELYKMLDYVLPEGVIFRTEDKEGNEYTKESDASCVELPVVVLINDMSISAAEYFAAVISEYNWGTLVGTNTLGKGHSQELIYLSDGSAVNLSTMRYFTPNGLCLAGVGLTPDVTVEISDEEYVGLYYGSVSHAEDTQLQKAIEILKN